MADVNENKITSFYISALTDPAKLVYTDFVKPVRYEIFTQTQIPHAYAQYQALLQLQQMKGKSQEVQNPDDSRKCGLPPPDFSGSTSDWLFRQNKAKT